MRLRLCFGGSRGRAVRASGRAADQSVAERGSGARARRRACWGVIVFVEEGYLSLLEVYGYEEGISPFPPPERLDFTPLPARTD